MRILLLSFILFTGLADSATSDNWSPKELALINALSLNALDSLPDSPSNRVANSVEAAALGKKLFNDPRFSLNGEISCASCHLADYNFSDDKPQAIGLGLTSRRAMPTVGMAYQRWFFWDGRADSLWSQALGPLENPLEHGSSRTQVSQLLRAYYAKQYSAVFGDFASVEVKHIPSSARPDKSETLVDKQWQAIEPVTQHNITQEYVNAGKAMAAFMRTINPSESAFDKYAKALVDSNKQQLNTLSNQQKHGLKLFIGKASCINCHNGPMLSNGEFHHVGTPDNGEVDLGRAAVIESISNNEFGCLSQWSDADKKRDCLHVSYMNSNKSRYLQAFKTPSLRNVALRPPYMHAGQFSSLKAVLENYREVAHQGLVDEVFHNDLSDQDLLDLEAFLEALTSIERVDSTLE